MDNQFIAELPLSLLTTHYLTGYSMYLLPLRRVPPPPRTRNKAFCWPTHIGICGFTPPCTQVICALEPHALNPIDTLGWHLTTIYLYQMFHMHKHHQWVHLPDACCNKAETKVKKLLKLRKLKLMICHLHEALMQMYIVQMYSIYNVNFWTCLVVQTNPHSCHHASHIIYT